MKKKLYLSLVIVALLCVVGWSGYAEGQRSSPGRQTWEYLGDDERVGGTENLQRLLNRRATEGWEFVQIGEGSIIFKRPR